MTDPKTPQPSPATPSRAGSEPSENMLRHYASILRRRWRWLVIGLAVGLVVGAASTLVIHESDGSSVHYYKATNTLAQSGPGANTFDASRYSMSQVALLAQSSELLDKVGKQTHLSRQQVATRLSATIRTDVNAIDVTAIDTDPETAAKLANSGATILRTMAEEQANAGASSQRETVENRVKLLSEQRKQLQATIVADPSKALLLNQQLRDVMSKEADAKEQLQNLPKPKSALNLTVLQPAAPLEINERGYDFRRNRNLNARSQLPRSTDASAPEFDENDLSGDEMFSTPARIAIGGGAGLLLGIIGAFMIEAWDDRVRRRDRAEKLTGLTVLAEIPHFSRDDARNHTVAVDAAPTSATGERYRAARTLISFALDKTADDHDSDPDAAARTTPVLMITSPGPGEGKTTSTANLAAAFADSGEKVLIIDGDFRRPAIARFLDPVPDSGSPDAPCATRIDGVQFLAAPRDAPNPDAAVMALREAIETQRSGYDLIILDTPPILTTNDAVELLSAADAVVVVLRADKTRAKPARVVAELLSRFETDVLGVVLNSCDRTEMNEYYGAGYDYDYQYLHKAGSKRADTQSRAHDHGAAKVNGDAVTGRGELDGAAPTRSSGNGFDGSEPGIRPAETNAAGVEGPDMDAAHANGSSATREVPTNNPG